MYILHSRVRLRSAAPAEQRASQCRSRRSNARADTGSLDDYYGLLQVPKNASEVEIKRQYRAMQRRYHPDIAGEGSRETSSKINIAYDVLTNKEARFKYDGMYKQAGHTSTFRHAEGLTGPLNERAVPLGAVDFTGMSQDAAIDWLQQWGTSITFGCEVPFPSPLQCDPVPEGVRFAVISAVGGMISSMGELYLEVDIERLAAEQVLSVAVTRVSKTPDRALPGEREILKTLKNALGYKKKNVQGMQASGWFATLLSGSLGFLPLLHFGDQDTGYDSYRIPQRCSMDPAKRPAATEEAM